MWEDDDSLWADYDEIDEEVDEFYDPETGEYYPRFGTK